MRRGSLRVQRLRQDLVLEREHHLEDARDARSSLRMPEVRLDRSEPERLLCRMRAAVRREECLRLDGIAERRRGAVRFHGVDVRRREMRVRQRLEITRSWAGPFGEVRPWLLPSWLTAEARMSATTG